MQYFKDRNYIMLYLDNFFSNFANSIYAVFTPVILYKSGVSISMILFIYAIQFLVMGIFTPLSNILAKRIGIANTKFLNYILKTISMVLVLNVNINIVYYLAIAIIFGLSGAINNPLNTYIPSKIVKEEFRGRFNTFKYILRCFSSILGYIFISIFLTVNNNFVIITTVFASYFLAYLSLLGLDKNKLKLDTNKSFKESYSYLFKNSENKRLKVVSGLRAFIIIERLIAVPLYLYIALMDLKTFAITYIVSTIVELLSLFITGNKLDKKMYKTFNVISIIKGLTSSVFIFFTNKYVLLFNQSLYKLVDNVYESSYCAVSQSKIENDKKDSMLLSMIHEMSLCFFEFIILIALAMISSINTNIAFTVMFITTIIVLITNSILVQSWKRK